MAFESGFGRELTRLSQNQAANQCLTEHRRGCSEPSHLSGKVLKVRDPTCLSFFSCSQDCFAVLGDHHFFWTSRSDISGLSKQPITSLVRSAKDHTIWTGCINLSLTECEVVAVEGQEAQFEIRPKDGEVWQGQSWDADDKSKREGTARPFLFEVRNKKERDVWMKNLAECKPSFGPLPVDAIAEDCPICMEAIGDQTKACRTKCGHDFHKDCLKHWLQQSSCCPICRTGLA